MYDEIKSVLYESNGVFNKKQEDKEIAQNRSLRIGRKMPGFEKRRDTADKFITENKKMLPSITNKDPSGMGTIMPSINNPKNNYKTLLKCTNKYTTLDQPPQRLNYAFYNLLEKLVLHIELTDKEKFDYEVERTKIDGVIHKIKILSIELERRDPLEWNTF